MAKWLFDQLCVKLLGPLVRMNLKETPEDPLGHSSVFPGAILVGVHNLLMIAQRHGGRFQPSAALSTKMLSIGVRVIEALTCGPHCHLEACHLAPW